MEATPLSHRAARAGFAAICDGASWRIFACPKEVLIASDGPSLADVLRRVEVHRRSGGEAAGMLRYEAGYALEPRLRHLLRPSHSPLAWFGLYDGCEQFARLRPPENVPTPLIHSPTLSMGREDYYAKLAAIRRYIEAGDVYQINFTTRVRFFADFSAWHLFRALCRRHPAPYAAFLNTGTEQIVSLSPERFFQIRGTEISVRPMKGTAPRGKRLDDDWAAGDALRGSEKNRAENVMIVDLMRNDLGRICRPGSVETTRLFEVEKYPSVWQMTSTVRGKLASGTTTDAIVRALFPSGSVTGAPKIRAMEIIAELERAPRGIYTGSIGYFARDRAHFNVAIRTLALDGSRGIMGIGGGITHDSSAAQEWEECHWKAAFLLHSEPEFQLIETFCWDRGYRFLREHLARLRDSARYWNFPFRWDQALSALRNAARAFPPAPQRVRMVLSADGAFDVTHRRYRARTFGRVAIANHRIWSADRFRYHKTTNRARYDKELVEARKRGLDDVLFLNERGELTEGTIHNVFLVKDGVWRTPPVSSGLLPGIFRGHILKTCSHAREAPLKMRDLERADSIYLCNSVRGVYRVVLEGQTSAPHRNIVSARRPTR